MAPVNKYICYKCWKVVESPYAEPEILYESSDVVILDNWKYYCDSCHRKYYPSRYLNFKKSERKF